MIIQYTNFKYFFVIKNKNPDITNFLGSKKLCNSELPLYLYWIWTSYFVTWSRTAYKHSTLFTRSHLNWHILTTL